MRQENRALDRPAFVPPVAIVEAVRGRSSRYGPPRGRTAEALALSPRSMALVVDRAELLLRAPRRFAPGGVDIADCVIEPIAKAQECETSVTFDAGTVEAAGITPVP
ncbi:MAG: VapC toxin family PIN domain ribonuclease [Burkholderiales bacterium]|nr:VapC toxin family PIN domain ribonuclease [Burkholderiales bacterium]